MPRTIRPPKEIGSAYDGKALVVYATRVETARVPVLVWPIPTSEGLFVVEHQDGTVHTVRPESLTFLGSKELFDQYSWEEGDTSHSDRDRRAAAEWADAPTLELGA